MRKWISAAGVLALVSCASGIESLDRNLTVLKALDKVERALICREGDGRADRPAVLRLICEIDRYRPMPDWATEGLATEPAKNLARALLMKHAGTLYGHPQYAAKGRSQVESLLADGGDLNFRDEKSLPAAVRDYYALMAESREDLRHEVRPGGAAGRPFWNGNARCFLYPPSFAFSRVEGAAEYRFRVIDDTVSVRDFSAAEPTASLAPVWAALPVGLTLVTCDAVDGQGRTLGRAGERRFWRGAPFDPSEYRPAARSYAEACRKVLDFLFDDPDVAYLERHGHPDLAKGSNFTSYPSKMQARVIDVMLTVAATVPERRDRAMRLARISADYLLSTRQPEGAPLAGFTATYVGTGQLSGTYGGQHMLVYPADAGTAFLRLHEATGGRAYLDAAVGIARTYLRLQGEDGSWYLKMHEKDGSPVTKNRLVPTSVIAFLERLHGVTGEAVYRTAADRAFAAIDRGPLKDWNWEGQFEDIRPAAAQYRNLTKHNACDTAMYLVSRFPGDRGRLEQARELLRYAEDQFVMWRTPCRADGTGSWIPHYPFPTWHSPSALEQYNCYYPIDASASKLIRTYLALYGAEGRALDLAKARALADSMVNNQDANGRIRTYWVAETEDRNDPLAGFAPMPQGGDWYNCMASDAQALTLLVRELERKGTKR